MRKISPAEFFRPGRKRIRNKNSHTLDDTGISCDREAEGINGLKCDPAWSLEVLDMSFMASFLIGYWILPLKLPAYIYVWLISLKAMLCLT